MSNKKLKIAVFVNTKLKVGGGFTYAFSIIKKLMELDDKDYVFVYYCDNVETISFLKQYNIKAILLPVKSKIKSVIGLGLFSRRISIEDILNQDEIDLAYLLGPFSIWKELGNIRFIFTIHDLGHRDVLAFPEVYNNKEFERREDVYKNGAIKSFYTIVGSEIQKRKLNNLYGVELHKISILPFLPNLNLLNYSKEKTDIFEKFDINGRYIFYPAQFWAHKNHVYILNGIKEYEDRYSQKIDVVFSGADYGTLSHVQRVAKELNLDNRLHYVGFVSEKDMASLYNNAIALVMPTYIQNTNIPPLEAFMLEIPVLYPNTGECAEILKKATINIDLNCPKSMAKALRRVEGKDEQIEELITIGKEYINTLNGAPYLGNIVDIFREYRNYKSTWS